MMGRMAQQADRKLAMFACGLCKVRGWLGCHRESCMTDQRDTAEDMPYVTRMLHIRRNSTVNF